MTAAAIEEVKRKTGSIIGAPELRAKDDTLADWVRKVAAAKPQGFAKVFDGKTVEQVVALIEPAEENCIAAVQKFVEPEPTNPLPVVSFSTSSFKVSGEDPRAVSHRPCIHRTERMEIKKYVGKVYDKTGSQPAAARRRIPERVTPEEYKETYYKEPLSKLTQAEVVRDIVALAGPNADPVVCRVEAQGSRKCHRRIASEWFGTGRNNRSRDRGRESAA